VTVRRRHRVRAGLCAALCGKPHAVCITSCCIESLLYPAALPAVRNSRHMSRARQLANQILHISRRMFPSIQKCRITNGTTHVRIMFFSGAFCRHSNITCGIVVRREKFIVARLGIRVLALHFSFCLSACSTSQGEILSKHILKAARTMFRVECTAVSAVPRPQHGCEGRSFDETERLGMPLQAFVINAASRNACFRTSKKNPQIGDHALPQGGFCLSTPRTSTVQHGMLPHVVCGSICQRVS
jgi:hypothetical protein